jgi:uncharacterized protein YjbI with pentapeptide repeats
MHRLKRDIWKAGIALAGLLLFLVLMVGIPVSAGAYGGTLGVAIAGPVQATPTVDLTVTALAKEQLALQVRQLQNQLQDQNNWFANNSTALIAAVATVIVALFGILQWAITVRQAQDKDQRDRDNERQKEIAAQDKELKDRQEAQDKELKDRQNEREKRAEERFQKVVEGLGSDKPEARAGAAIMLRTFLQPGYEQFYRQAFDLAVAHLRLRHVDSKKPEPLDSLSQALITVFKESFSRTRRILEGQSTQLDPQSLDASHIQLDNAFLIQSALERIWMREALLREARLYNAKLSGAYLRRADLRGVYLNGGDLTKVNLTFANLSKARLKGVNLSGADLSYANLSEAELNGAEFNGARFSRANLSKADLSETDLENALSLEKTDLRGVKGLTKEQLAACKAKGAIIDEDATGSPAQSIVSPLLPSQSSDAQAPSPTPAQVNTPPPSTDAQR